MAIITERAIRSHVPPQPEQRPWHQDRIDRRNPFSAIRDGLNSEDPITRRRTRIGILLIAIPVATTLFTGIVFGLEHATHSTVPTDDLTPHPQPFPYEGKLP